MPSEDSDQDFWTRLRTYCQYGHDLRYPPLTEEQARALGKKVGIYVPPEEQHLYTPIHNGMMRREEVVCYPPATEEQLLATEERLGFPLPDDLRRLYAEIANGGLNLGICYVFHGAIGGCGEYADVRQDGRTIEELASRSNWRMHPRIEEALFRHPGRYVIADSMPEGFVWIAEGGNISTEIDGMTGRVYYTEGWGYLPDRPPEQEGGPFDLICIAADAPSLTEWFEQWMDEHRSMPLYDRSELLPEMVETDDLPDPDIVWRGLYRFGPDWRLKPDDEGASEVDEIDDS